MTVSATHTFNGPYLGNGATTEFPFTFSAADADEVTVYVDGVETAAGFTVALTAGSEGGTVTFSVAPAADAEIVIASNPDFSQTTSFEDAGAFLPSSHDRALDRAARRDIYLRGQVNRALKAPLGETPGELPTAAERAGKFFTWNADGNPSTSTGAGADAALRTDLAASTGGALVGVVSGKSGGVARSITAKASDTVSLKDFGAAGAGADETTAVSTALDAARSGDFRMRVPEGVYSVTSGYTNDQAHSTVRIAGEGRKGVFGQATPSGTVLELDSASADSFFYTATEQYNYLDVDGVVCTTAQAVTDRKFFKLNGVGPVRFDDVEFDTVDKPISVEIGGYIQSASFRNLSFYDSGTIHSEVGDAAAETDPGVYVDYLRGTLWLIENVNHEGTVPANTEKVVMNLYGVRDIAATNLLLEGALPSAGWTALKLGNPYNEDYIRREYFFGRNVHIEFAGTQPAYAVDQEGGTAIFEHLNGLSASAKYKLSDMGKAIIAYTSFYGTASDPASFFEREDSQCIVQFQSCTVRLLDIAERGFIHHLTQTASATDGVGQCVVSNTGSKVLYRFDGGIIATGGDLTLVQSGSTPYVSTDATYGRKWVIPPAGTFDVALRVAGKGLLIEGDQVWVQAKVKLPTFTGGSISFTVGSNTTLSLATQSFTTASSGQVVDVFIPYTRKAADAWTSVGFRVTSTTVTGLSGDIEVYALEIGLGRTVPQIAFQPFPKNVSTSAAAMPSLGSWAQGDYVANNTPAANGVLGWLRLTTGSAHVAGTDWLLVRSIQQQAAVADASTAHALNATFSDVEVETALNALGTTINTLIARLETAGILAP